MLMLFNFYENPEEVLAVTVPVRGDPEDPRGAVMSPGPSRKLDGCAVRPGLPDALTTVLCSLPAGGDLGWPPWVAHRSW